MPLVTRMATLQAEQRRELKGTHRECNTLTMNSVTALMTSHNGVNSKALIESAKSCQNPRTVRIDQID
jgi:hypothetical protein